MCLKCQKKLILFRTLKKNLDFETKLKLKSLRPAISQLKIVQVQNECSNKKAYTVLDILIWVCKWAEWLFGCENKNAFFCFTYLIMQATVVTMHGPLEGEESSLHLKKNYKLR